MLVLRVLACWPEKDEKKWRVIVTPSELVSQIIESMDSNPGLWTKTPYCYKRNDGLEIWEEGDGSYYPRVSWYWRPILCFKMRKAIQRLEWSKAKEYIGK